jgi:hypothetical protein
MYYWRRRLPNALVSWFHKRHLFLSLQTPDPNFARRLVVLLDAKLEEVVTAFEQADIHLTPSQVDGLLRDVVTTGQLIAHPINLPSWLSDKKPPPFSHPSRAKKNGEK